MNRRNPAPNLEILVFSAREAVLRVSLQSVHWLYLFCQFIHFMLAVVTILCYAFYSMKEIYYDLNDKSDSLIKAASSFMFVLSYQIVTKSTNSIFLFEYSPVVIVMMEMIVSLLARSLLFFELNIFQRLIMALTYIVSDSLLMQYLTIYLERKWLIVLIDASITIFGYILAYALRAYHEFVLFYVTSSYYFKILFGLSSVIVFFTPRGTIYFMKVKQIEMCINVRMSLGVYFDIEEKLEQLVGNPAATDDLLLENLHQENIDRERTENGLVTNGKILSSAIVSFVQLLVHFTNAKNIKETIVQVFFEKKEQNGNAIGKSEKTKECMDSMRGCENKMKEVIKQSLQSQ